MSNVTVAIIICCTIGGLFLLLGVAFAVSALLARDKKEKVEAEQEEASFFANLDGSQPKLAAAARTKAATASDYTDLTALPSEVRSQGTTEIKRPLSHKEIFGSLSDDEADLPDRD